MLHALWLSFPENPREFAVVVGPARAILKVRLYTSNHESTRHKSMAVFAIVVLNVRRCGNRAGIR
jgi:hypothetical protein